MKVDHKLAELLFFDTFLLLKVDFGDPDPALGLLFPPIPLPPAISYYAKSSYLPSAL